MPKKPKLKGIDKWKIIKKKKIPFRIKCVHRKKVFKKKLNTHTITISSIRMKTIISVLNGSNTHTKK